jgi:spore coat protein U-like protein
MSEVARGLNSWQRIVLAASALSPVALGACSTSEKTVSDTIVVGVECSDPNAAVEVISVEDIDNANPVHGGRPKDVGGRVDVECSAGEISSMVLLSGSAGTVQTGNNTTGAVEITYEYQQGGGWDGDGDMDPTVEFDTGAYNGGEIVFDSIKRISEVNIVDPNSATEN